MEENENKINLIKFLKAKSNLYQLFSLIYYRKKLNILKYNKYLLNKLNISLEDFKISSRRYIIGDRNGKGKEYLSNSNILIYEGEYLSGLKNGKGKEYESYGNESILI